VGNHFSIGGEPVSQSGRDRRPCTRHLVDDHARGRSDVGGDPIVIVLSDAVSDAHLERMRGEGASYVLPGKSELDLALALDVLNRELSVKRLLLEGGGAGTNAPAGLRDPRQTP
jgi:riboflavin biosynthesis pyrimidine reductase